MIEGYIQNSVAFLTPLIAFIAVYIAWQQAATNKKRLQHELFEKRFDVYSKFKDVFVQVNESARFEDHQLEKFVIDTLEVEFLFGTDVSKFRERVIDKASDVCTGRHNRDSINMNGEQLEQAYEQHRKGTRWFVENTQELLNTFRPYLDFE